MKIRKGPGRFAAVAGMSAVVTAGFGWLEALLGWGVAAILRWTLPPAEKKLKSRGCAAVMLAGGIILLAAVMLAAEEAFPEDGTFPFVSLSLFLLLYRTMTGEKKTGQIVSNVLGLILLGLLGTILVFGMVDVDWSQTLPTEFLWKRVLIIIGITAPWWCGDEKEKDWGWFFGSAAVCVGMSVMVRGLLGAALTEYVHLPMYQAVQTVKILGTVQRFESLLAAAVLLGTYAQLSIVSEHMETAVERLAPGVNLKVWTAGILLISFLLEHGYRSVDRGVQERISTVFWGFVPVFALWVVICGKIRKNEKSA